MVSMGEVQRDAVEDVLVLGELALDGATQPVLGVMPAAIAAAAASHDLICSHDCGSEAAWAEGLSGFASANAKNGTSSAEYARSC